MAEHLIVYRPEDWLPDGLDADLAGGQELREAYQKHSAARTRGGRSASCMTYGPGWSPALAATLTSSVRTFTVQ